MIGPDQLEILQPLGADQATFVARETSTGEARLVVVERVTRASPVPAARAELLRRGRALRALEHPKVVRVRDVFERDGEVLVVSDFVDGEWLSTLMMLDPRPPVSIMLRLVIDVLEALAALHDLQEGPDKPLGFVHGAVGPDTVLVTDDGVAEIARACRLPRPGTNERYIPPELRRGEGPAEVRSDVYAAGAILRDVLAAAPGDATWAEPLTDIAWRACSVDMDNRWPSAAAMATAIRRIAGPRLATATTVAEFVRRRFGEKIRARRTGFEALHDGAPPSSEPLSLRPSDMEVVDPSAPTLGGNTPPLPLVYPERQAPIAKTPSLTVEPEPPEPVTRRRAGSTTDPGVSPPSPPGPPPPPPPPPPAPQQQSLPPPTIIPDDLAPGVEHYRRQMPTFPTFEDAPRRHAAVQGLVVAGAMVMTFAVGWWVGRTYAPIAEVQQPVCPSAAAAQMAAATVPSPALTPPPTPAVTQELTQTTASAASELAPLPAALSTALPTAAPVATLAPRPTAAPTPSPVAVAPRPAPVVAPAPNASSTAAPAPKASSNRPGYVPEEL